MKKTAAKASKTSRATRESKSTRADSPSQLEDPRKLFNSSLDGNVRRAIDFHEGDRIDEAAFKALVREAVELNRS